MGADIFRLLVLRDGVAEFLVLQLLEEIDVAASGNPRRVEVGGARLVGARFLLAGEGQHLADRRALAEAEQRHAGIARARRDRARRRDERQQRNARCGRSALGAEAHRVPARDMPQFVRQDALDLVGVVRLQDRARVDVDRLPGHDEGVEAVVRNQHDIDVRRIESRRGRQRRNEIVEPRLGFGIAKNALRGGGLRHEGSRRQQAERKAFGVHARPHMGIT